MAKIVIKEERLQELIQESIEEVLLEWGWLDNIADKAGRAVQSVRTGFRNAARSFNAGKNYIKDLNKDYNEYSRYGDKEDALRRMGLGGYENYRYDLEKKTQSKSKGRK